MCQYCRNLRLLAPVSALATLCELYSLAVVFYYIFRDPLPPFSDRPQVTMQSPHKVYLIEVDM